MKPLRAAAAVFVSCFLAVALFATVDASLQMQTGNPTSATADPNNHTRYLLQRPQYALDYNDTTRSPNWVSWDLTHGDHGTVDRSDFQPDPALPGTFYAVTTTDYNGVGAINFNRGHMAPSADRNDTVENNIAVFYMTNITPQAADNNQGPWENFEAQCRTLAAAGNEVLLISGPSLFGGAKIPSGVADIPTYVWKIALVVPAGAGSALSRIDANTRVIALKMPNVNGIRSTPWTDYIVSVSEIEADTGYQFFTNLPASVANALRVKIDGGATGGGGAPTILTHPAPQAVLAGGSATFTVVASGSALTYQWRKDGDAIAGATNLTYTLASVQAADAGNYDVVVSNASGSATSNAAALTLSLPTAPTITTQPANQTALAGGTATFTVAVSGLPAPTYQWYKNDPAPVAGATSAIAGATNASLTLTNVQAADSGSFYTVVATNSVGTTTSNAATLTVTSVPPTITTQPSTQAATVGGNVTFTVAATGSAPLSYQWRKNGVALAGQTTTTLGLTNVQASDGGSYDVLVTNFAGSVASNLAVLDFGVSPIYWDFATANPSSGAGGDIAVSALAQGNNFGTTTLITNSSVSSGYSGASGGNNAGAAARKTATLDRTAGTGSVYFQFMLTPAAADKQVTFSGISFGSRSTSTGPVSYTIFTSVDGFTNPVATGGFNGSTTGNDSVWRLVTPALTAATGAPGAGVTVRIYGWGSNTASNPSSNTANWRIDDLKVTASTGGASTVAVTGTTPRADATGVGVATPITITFNQPVTVTSGWVNVVSALHGSIATTSAASADFRTFTLTPANLAYSDTITVTLNASLIADKATGTSRPTSNYTFNFKTAAPTAPAITMQPAPLAVVVGGSASFSVVATGTAPLSYEWRKDGQPIAGATTATLTFGAVGLGDAGNYTVVVNNVTNQPATSAGALLTVSTTPIAPTITTPPQSQTVALGGTASFSVGAGGTTPLSYQWRKNGVALTDGVGISGATSATLTLTGVSYLSSASYDVVVSNAATPSATSAAATLTVTSAGGASVVYFTGGTYLQNFDTLPASGSFSYGGDGPYALDVAPAAGGVSAPGMTGWTFANYAGDGSATFSVGNGSANSGTAGSFGASGATDRALGSLASGSVVSRLGVAIVNATGQTITQVTLGYAGEQWRRGGANTANTLTLAYAVGATSLNMGAFVDVPALSFHSAVLGTTSGALDGNAYANRTVIGGELAGLNWAPGEVLVLRWSDVNDTGSDDTLALDDLTLSLTPAVSPSLATQPVAQMVFAGAEARFSVTATGNPAPTYQWRKGGTPLVNGGSVAGATSNTLVLSSVTTANAGDYDVVITNGVGTITSNAAALVVNKLPATVALANLTAVYDGTPKAVSATTTPAGLNVTLTYGGGSTAPTNAGTYDVVATIVSTTYEGSATGTLTIAPATPVATWAAPASIVYGTPLGATQLNATANVAGTFAYTPAAGAVLAAGDHTLSAVFTPSDAVNYTSATVTTTLSVAKAPTTIGWAAPAAITYGTALGAAQLNATANVPGAFTYSPAAGTVLNAGESQTLSVTFAPTNAANHLSANATTTITVNKATAAVTLAGLYRTYDGAPKPVTVTTTPANLAVTVTYDGKPTAPTLPGAYAVIATATDNNYTGTASGTLVIAAAALVNRAPTINGGLDGSVQVMTAENITLNGSAFVSGDLLVRGSPAVQLNGRPTYGSTVEGTGDAAPADYTVMLNGGATLAHVVRRTNAIALPTVTAPAAPSGTRDVVLNNANQSAGDFATVRNLTLNGNAGAVAVPAGTYGNVVVNGDGSLVLGDAGATTPAIYALQSLTLNGRAKLTILGPVTLTLANGTVFNGTAGAEAHPEWLMLRVANGGVTVNGNASVHGTIVAPTGAVTISGAVHGTTASEQLIINSGGLLEQP